MQVADGSDISRLRGTLFVSPPPPLLLLLPGGQKGGLKSNWRLAGEEPTRGASRVALSDNCK